jgi:hypothetical protein
VDRAIRLLWDGQSEVVGDKLPAYAYYLRALLEAHRVDHLFVAVRDPMDIVASWLKPRDDIPEGTIAEAWFGVKGPLETFREALHCHQALYEGMRWAKRHAVTPVAIHNRLWNTPEGRERAVGRIADRLGRDPAGAMEFVSETGTVRDYGDRKAELWRQIEPELSDEEVREVRRLRRFVRDVGGCT